MSKEDLVIGHATPMQPYPEGERPHTPIGSLGDAIHADIQEKQKPAAQTNLVETAIAEVKGLYNPAITDLERNEHRGEDRPVVYLDSVLEVLTKLRETISREGEI